MIKFEKNALKVIRAIEERGYIAYAFGECVLRAMKGENVLDWDVVTDMPMGKLRDAFSESEMIGDVLRVQSPADKENLDPICDIHSIGKKSFEEFLLSEGVSVLGIATNPNRGNLDPAGGLEDFRRSKALPTSEVDKAFAEKPLKMLDIVRLAANLGLELDGRLVRAIVRNWERLEFANRDYIRDSLIGIITSPNAGKGLTLLKETGLMPIILGPHIAEKTSASEMKAFDILCQNIDQVQVNQDRRLGLLFTCFDAKKAQEAIEGLNFPEPTFTHLMDATREMIKIQFLGNLIDFKKYLCNIGMERYDYLNNLSKAQRIVYDQSTIKIESRLHMMKEIKELNQPVFVSDLVIDEDDLIAEGICTTEDEARELLGYVVAVVHLDRNKNERQHLLKMARKFKKSSFARVTRYVKWLR